ncbi:hypothetical protein B0H13DRAFT_2357727 [Mycena leptocephala]|nr:hypothetical protein B0H13DRAFT_2357727 [Mycena leptocephala]
MLTPSFWPYLAHPFLSLAIRSPLGLPDIPALDYVITWYSVFHPVPSQLPTVLLTCVALACPGQVPVTPVTHQPDQSGSDAGTSPSSGPLPVSLAYIPTLYWLRPGPARLSPGLFPTITGHRLDASSSSSITWPEAIPVFDRALSPLWLRITLPPFRTCRNLVFVSLYAQVLHCLLLITGASTLDQCADSIQSFKELEAHARAIQRTYANASVVSDLWWKRNMADGSEDMNACLLLRDALVSREFTDPIKARDSGRIVLVLKVLALSYRGNGRTKYTYEMMHLIHNLTHVWPLAIQKIVLNNWLLNPTGNPFSWVEADLMQEHMNYWIKTIYQAHGSGASWEWLEMIAPCISVLRCLSTTIHQVLGSDQGTKHEPADLKEDIALLMASLAEHDAMEEDEEPTLTRNTAADVALDMDGGDDGFLFEEEDEEDFYIDDGAIDNSDDDYVDD